MRMIISVASMTAMLASCSFPPKPPTIDDTTRRPANSALAVERQVCVHELHNSRRLAAESDRWAVSMSAALANMDAQHQDLSSLLPAKMPALVGNIVLIVHFGFGSTQVNIPPETEETLIGQPKLATLIVLRGRTDGWVDSPAESRSARARADAFLNHLTAFGIDAAHIRTNYQPSGDRTADNVSAAGSALNRRVEIELYRVPTVTLDAIQRGHD